MILRILGIFISSFSRKIHHPWIQIAPPISQGSFVLWTVAPLNRDCTLPLRSVSNELMKEMVVVRTTCKTRYNRMHTAPGKHHYTKIAVIIHHLLKLQSHPGDWPFCHWWYEKTEQAFQMLLCHVQVLPVQEWKYVEDGILNVSWRV